MIYFLRLLLCFFLYTSSAFSADTPFLNTQIFRDSFGKQTANRILGFLASDSLKGRNTPSPELETAAEFIAKEFQRVGLKPINGSYFHQYAVKTVDLSTPTTWRLKKNDSLIPLELKNDFVPFASTGECDFRNLELVFVGYGLSGSPEQFDEYKDIEVQGKIVVFVVGSPKFAGAGETGISARETALQKKLATAEKHGAVGAVIFSNPLQRAVLRPVGYPFPSVFSNPKRAIEPALRMDLDNDSSLPNIHVGEKAANILFGSVDSLRMLLQKIETEKMPQSKLLPNVSCSELRISLKTERHIVRNVVGMLHGDVPHRYVVVGAHYDHVGYSKPNNSKQDSIFNGADDNASGTTGLILCAEALSGADKKPRQSIVFAAFSGEEKGLYGSRAFTEQPPLPLEHCTAMINMDMIGRNNSDTLSIGGNTRSPDFAEINEQANKTLQKPFVLKYDIEHFFFRSDQANFAKKNIPVIFYFSGEHRDYHKPSDEISLINFGKLLRVAELCAKTTWRSANLEKTMRYIPQKGD